MINIKNDSDNINKKRDELNIEENSNVSDEEMVDDLE